MIDFDILQLIYLFSMFFVLFLCITKIVLHNINRPVYGNYPTNRVFNKYTRVNNLTVDDYTTYNKFLIWLFVSEF